MQSKHLPRKDAAILRDRAIGHFKRRFPKYSGLNLSLVEETLVISCGRTDPITRLLKEIPKIAINASIAIGVTCVNLEINGQKLFGYELPDLGERKMVLLEEEVVPINGYHQLIDIPVAPEVEEGFQPEAVSVISLSELGTRLACPEEKLLKALDHKNQRFFKEANKEKVLAVVKLLDEQIKPNVIEDALRPIELLEMGDSYGIRETDVESAKVWLTIQSVPAMLRNVVEDLRKWNPNCIQIKDSAPNDNTAATSAPTPAKRGRKPKAKVAVAEAELTEEAKPKRYQIADRAKEQQVVASISKAIDNNRWKNVAKVLMKTMGDRSQEFLASAHELDERYISFLDGLLAPIVKEMNLARKESTEKREDIKGKITQAFVGMTDEPAAAES